MSIHTLFIGTYAHAEQPGVYACTFDTDTGALAELTSHTGITRPSFLIVHPNNEWVYAVCELGITSHDTPGSLFALKYDRAANKLETINEQPSGGDWPCHLTLDATNRWLFTTNYGSGNLSVYPINSDGSIGEMSDHIQHTGHGPNPERQETAHTHSTTLTPDNRFAIVADLGIDELDIYALDAANGTLQLHHVTHTPAGAGPRHTAFHPNGRVLYVANELANAVGVYAYDSANGTLSETQMLPTLPPDAPPNTVADIHLSEAADRLYVSNRGHDSIAVYAVKADGSLASMLGTFPAGGKTPRNFALAPDGKFILVATMDSDTVSVMRLRDGANEIGAPIAQIRIPGASCIQFMHPHA